MDGYVSAEQRSWEAYLRQHGVEEIYRAMTTALITAQPEDAEGFMLDFLQRRRYGNAKEEVDYGAQCKDDEEEDDDDEVDDAVFEARLPSGDRQPRSSIMCKQILSEDFEPPVFAKSDAEERFLYQVLASIIFMKHLTRKELKVLAAAMKRVDFEDKTTIVRQGDEGDKFFVVEEGTCDIEVKDVGKVMEIPHHAEDGPPRRFFGELALLYDAPRAATVTSAGAVKAWSLDRATFKSILQDSDHKKIALYARFIQSVPAFRDLTVWQTRVLCQSLTPIDYAQGDVVVSQGDEGNDFFIIESGTADCFKTRADDPSAPPLLVGTCKEGDFFGELALLRDAPRAATVKASSPLSVVKIDRPTFKRMIGSLDGLRKVYS